MTIQTNVGGVTTYMHSAFAIDASGTGFSLTEFDGAVYVGSYTDRSSTESTDPHMYTWILIGGTDIETEPEDEGVDPDIYDLQNDVESLRAVTNQNTADIQEVQESIWNTGEE